MKQHNITLTLREEEGMIIFDDNDNVSITYLGYSYMNNIVNASIHMPDRFLIDGEVKENPYIVSNEKGEIIEVIANSIAFCQFNGNIVSASATVRMNVEVYLTNDLMELVSLDKEGGALVKKGSYKEDNISIIRPVNDALDLVVNIKNHKVQKIFQEYTYNKAKGDRKIISISQRNALKKLPPFAVPIKNIIGMPGNRSGEVTLTLYGNDSDRKIIDVLAIAKSINADVVTSDLIDIKTGEITNVTDINATVEGALSSGNINVIKNDNCTTDKVIREKLIARYKKLKKGTFEKASQLLFPNKNMKSMSNKEIETIIICAEKMLINN